MRSARLRRLIAVSLFALATLALVVPAVGQSDTIPYGGTLRTAEGDYFEGTVDIDFSIHDDPESGTQLWQEHHAAVDVVDGEFQVDLGVTTSLAIDWSSDRQLWLFVSINDEPLLPNEPFSSVPFAFACGAARDGLAAQLAALEARLEALEAASVGGVSWSDITDRPTGLDDGDDLGLTAVDWTDLTNRPEGLDDGDDLGLTAVDWTDLTNRPEGLDNGDDVGLTSVEWSTISNRPEGLDDGDDVGGAGAVTWADINDVPLHLTTLDSVLSFEDENNDLVFTAVNVHVRSGAGSTDAEPNGLGNLVVGYNEDDTGRSRAGSHNLVVGRDHEYLGYGGLVAGMANRLGADAASIVGGSHNEVSAQGGSVLGGERNQVSGDYASISGGASNDASGPRSSVLGGNRNRASGDWASIAGGYLNTAEGESGSICGGTGNSAAGQYAAVLGGRTNSAQATASAVTGGGSNRASGAESTVLGGHQNEASGIYSAVVGGSSSAAPGYISVALGGRDVEAGLDLEIQPVEMGLRITGSPSHRLELFRQGVWGTVSGGGFDDNDATVACRQLGFDGGAAETALDTLDGSGVIWVTQLACDGSETRLADCAATWGPIDTPHTADIGVECWKDGDLRTETGGSLGRVEVFHDGSWGTICDELFGDEEADVACRQMGFASGTVRPSSSTNDGSGTIWMSWVECAGWEERLDQCSFGGWANHECDHTRDVGVTCAF